VEPRRAGMTARTWPKLEGNGNLWDSVAVRERCIKLCII
jgi:hypothetical protein